VLKVGYATKRKANIPIFGIKNKDLREFTTTEKDMEKGVSRIPLQLARIYEEDVMEELAFTPVSGGSGAASLQS
jgi:indole-3-glycerol phosphate synthase